MQANRKHDGEHAAMAAAHEGHGYNVVAIPLAAGVLPPVGILLSPAVGAVLMSLSTIVARPAIPGAGAAVSARVYRPIGANQSYLPNTG